MSVWKYYDLDMYVLPYAALVAVVVSMILVIKLLSLIVFAVKRYRASRQA